MLRQIDWKIMKWGLGVGALAAVLFGCAGNTVVGGGTTATTATTATTGLFSEVASVNLPDTPGLLNYVFLTGAGRAGDVESATVHNMAVSDIIGTEISDSGKDKPLTLTSYLSLMLSDNIDLLGQQSRQFNTAELNVTSYSITDSNGTQSFNSIVNMPNTQSVYVRTFKGRQTHVPLFFDADTFNTQASGTGVEAVFDPVWFDTINRVVGDNVAIRGFLSDYIGFDVTAISPASLPSLSLGNGTATRIFFSGDGFAMGGGNPAGGGAPFELIYPAGQDASVIGGYSAPITLAGAVTPGTYTTRGIDPSDVTTTDPVLARKITSFQGTWKDYFSQRLNPFNGLVEDMGYIKNVHAFEALSIPTSLDDERQQVVMFTETVTANGNGTKSATITSMMWGYLDLSIKKVFVYPLTNINDPSAITNRVGEVVGDIGTMFTSTGASTLSPQQMRFANFTFGAPPSGFPASGKIVVIRR